MNVLLVYQIVIEASMLEYNFIKTQENHRDHFTFRLVEQIQHEWYIKVQSFQGMRAEEIILFIYLLCIHIWSVLIKCFKQNSTTVIFIQEMLSHLSVKYTNKKKTVIQWSWRLSNAMSPITCSTKWSSILHWKRMHDSA